MCHHHLLHMVQFMFIDVQCLKPLLIWLIYTTSAVAILCGLFVYFPEQAFYNWYPKPKGTIDEYSWDEIFMTVVLALTVLLNCIFILMTTLVYKTLRRRKVDFKAER